MKVISDVLKLNSLDVSHDKVYLFSDYAVICQTICLETIDYKIKLLNNLSQHGVNVVRILDYKLDEASLELVGGRHYSNGYCLEERAVGKCGYHFNDTIIINENDDVISKIADYYEALRTYASYVSEYAKIPQKHYDKYALDCYLLGKEKVFISPLSTDLFYDEQKGFTFTNVEVGNYFDPNTAFLVYKMIDSIIYHPPYLTIRSGNKNINISTMVDDIPIEISESLFRNIKLILNKLIQSLYQLPLKRQTIDDYLNRYLTIREKLFKKGISQDDMIRKVERIVKDTDFISEKSVKFDK